MSSATSVPSRNKNSSPTSSPHEQMYDPLTSSARGEPTLEPYNPPANRFGKLRNSTTANADHHHHHHHNAAASKVSLPREDAEHLVRYKEAETEEIDCNKKEGANNQKPNKKKAKKATVASKKRNTNLPTTSSVQLAAGAPQEVVNKSKTDANANNNNNNPNYPLPAKSNAPYDEVVVSGYGDEYGTDYHMSPPSPPPSFADEHPSLSKSRRRNSNIMINNNTKNKAITASSESMSAVKVALSSAVNIGGGNTTKQPPTFDSPAGKTASKGNRSNIAGARDRGNKKGGRAHWPRGLGQDEATLSCFASDFPSSSSSPAWRRGNQQLQRPPRGLYMYDGASEGALPSHTWQDEGQSRREKGKRVTQGSVPTNRWEAYTTNKANTNMSNPEMVAKEGGRDFVSHDRSGHDGCDSMEMDLDHPLEEDVLEADEECEEEMAGKEEGDKKDHNTARQILAPQPRGSQPIISSEDNPLLLPQPKEEPFSTAATTEQTAAIERSDVSASGSIPCPIDHENLRAAAPTAPAASPSEIMPRNNEPSTTSNVTSNSGITSNTNNAHINNVHINNNNTDKSSTDTMEWTDKTVGAPVNANTAEKAGNKKEAEKLNKSVTPDNAKKNNDDSLVKQHTAEIEEKAREAEEKYEEEKTETQLAKDADYHNHLHLRDLVPFITHGSKSVREVRKAEDKARKTVVEEERALAKSIEEEKKLLKKKLADEEKEAKKRHKAAEKEESTKKKDRNKNVEAGTTVAVGSGEKEAAAAASADDNNKSKSHSLTFLDTFIDKIKGVSHSNKDVEGRAKEVSQSQNDKKKKETNATSRALVIPENKTTKAQPLKIETETWVNRGPAFVNASVSPNPTRRRQEGKRKYRRTYGSIVSGFVGSPTQTPLGQPSRSISAEDLRKREKEKAMRRGKASRAKEAERPIVTQPVSAAFKVASLCDSLTVADAEHSTKRMNNKNAKKKTKITTPEKARSALAEAQKKGKAKSRILPGRAVNSSAAAGLSSNVVPGVSFRDKLLEKKSNDADVVAPAVIVVIPPSSSAPTAAVEGERGAAHNKNGGVRRPQRFRSRKPSQTGVHQVEDLLSPTTHSYVTNILEAEEESDAEHAEQLLRERDTAFSSHRRHRSNRHKIH